jgi:hypothetical protein
MIQFRRGNTSSWRRDNNILAAGQPGYDKNKHKLKVGDGEHLWKELPYASGLSAEEILDAETEAKKRYSRDKEDKTIITYGTESPDNNTVGQLYLQYYETEPESDYVVEFGINNNWTYRKWHSGIAECWGTFNFTAAPQDVHEKAALYFDTINRISYPIVFKKVPAETATIQSPSGIVWLATNDKNTKNLTAGYTLISPDKLNNATYSISFNIKGSWK